MKSFSGEIKSVKLDLRACAVSVIAEEGTGLKGIEYTGDKKLEPDAVFADGVLTITQKPVGIFGGGIMAVNKPRLTVTLGKDTVLNYFDIILRAGERGRHYGRLVLGGYRCGKCHHQRLHFP